jgi:hypothetical protein
VIATRGADAVARQQLNALTSSVESVWARDRVAPLDDTELQQLTGAITALELTLARATSLFAKACVVCACRVRACVTVTQLPNCEQLVSALVERGEQLVMVRLCRGASM